MTRGEPGWWTNEVLPFVVMLMTVCLDMSVLTIVKAAMNGGMPSIVYVVYHDILGTMLLLPFFVVHVRRNARRPRLTFHILFRFFVLGLLGVSLSQVLLFIGIGYSSPIMVGALSNLSPAVTFVLAVMFRMEKIDMRSPSSIAKMLGTIIAISGAMLFTFYQGPTIFVTIPSPHSPSQLYSSEPSNWVFGGLIILVSGLLSCLWYILQAATAKEFSDQPTMVFFFCLFGTIQSIAISPFLEPNPSAWVVRPGVSMVAIVCGGVYAVMLRMSALTWCLEKKGPVFVAMFSPLSIVISVIMGVTFLGDLLHLGSVVGAVIVVVGFYTVMWGQVKEKNKLEDLDIAAIGTAGTSNQNVPLLRSLNDA